MLIYLIVSLLVQIGGLSRSLQHPQSIFSHFEDQNAPEDSFQETKKTFNIYVAASQSVSAHHPELYSRSKYNFINHSVVEDLLVYSDRFRRLNFNLEDQQIQQLAFDIISLYVQDKVALFYIAAYFLRACEILEQKKTPVPQIAKMIKRKVIHMMNITSIQTYRKRKYGSQLPLNQYSFDWSLLEKQVVPMTAKSFKLLPTLKDNQIEDIIIQMASYAQEIFPLFDFITQKMCRSNNCLSYHINLKIESRDQIPQMKRVKEKLLRDHFKTLGQRCLNTFLNIGWKRKIEESGFENLLAKVYEGLNEVEFVVKDMLRAKCMFLSITQIYNTGLSIVEMVKNLQQGGLAIKIVQFQNRLHKITCDILLIIQIEDLACQIQLALDYDENMFEISHKMYQISRSKVFSPVVLLFDWFEKIAPEFLSRIGQFLMKQGEVSTRKPETLMKEYELLNQFFHLTSYHDLGHISEKEFQKSVSEQISILKEQKAAPFTNIDTQL